MIAMVNNSSEIQLFKSSYDGNLNSEDLRKMKYFNRQAFGDLDIPQFLNKRHHRVLLFHISSPDEYVYYIYPGDKNNENLPKHDFLPHVYPELTDVEKLLKITDLFKEFEQINDDNPEIMPYLATVLCRLAYMKDHKLFRNQLDHGEYDCDKNEYKELKPLDFTCYKLDLNPQISTFFRNEHIEICGMDPESFFHFVDLLAQNEDMHYGNVQKTRGMWSTGASQYPGRTNFLLTCVRAIGVITKTSSFSAFAENYSLAKVSPATPEEIKKITNGMFLVFNP